MRVSSHTTLMPVATTVAYVQAILGQMYLAILIARLVGTWIA